MKNTTTVTITIKALRTTETIHEKLIYWKAFIKLRFGYHKNIYIILNLVRQ